MLAEVGALNPLQRASTAAMPYGRPKRAMRRPARCSTAAAEQTDIAARRDDARGAPRRRFPGTGLTVGRHPMALRRRELDELGIAGGANCKAYPTALRCA